MTPGWHWRTYDFPQSSYADLAIERPLGPAADTVAYVVPERINDAWIAQFQVTCPQFPHFAFGLNVQAGRDINFVEPGRSALLAVAASADFRPTDKLRATTAYNLVRRDRAFDGTRFSTQHIARVKLEYQLSRPIFLRLVGQYAADEQASLLDPATGFPLLRQDGSGAYAAALRRSSNELQMDCLFSYRPGPGTVIFFGYGSNLSEPDAFQFDNLKRTKDGFFVKLSYLFRL
ncbi:MAG TPA: hypothetical protein VJ997_04205 [Longimicrobiales bacterium]|nr:hypothetical protein [Longimicrobiales bacterium]